MSILIGSTKDCKIKSLNDDALYFMGSGELYVLKKKDRRGWLSRLLHRLKRKDT